MTKQQVGSAGSWGSCGIDPEQTIALHNVMSGPVPILDVTEQDGVTELQPIAMDADF